MIIILNEENTKALLAWWQDFTDYSWDEDERGYPYPLCENIECKQCMVWKNRWIENLQDE